MDRAKIFFDPEAVAQKKSGRKKKKKNMASAFVFRPLCCVTQRPT